MNLTEELSKIALLFGAQWVEYLLVFCSILTLGLILDRIIFFKRTSRGDFSFFIQNFTERLNTENSLEQVRIWCLEQDMFEARVAAIGLSKAGQSLRSAEESMSAAMIATKTKMERGLALLGTLANNTPFIGLFGTILGIIKAFHVLSVSPDARSEFIMAAISEALIATALGIFVAIPAVIGYNLLNRSIKKRIANTEMTAHILLTHIGKEKTV